MRRTLLVSGPLLVALLGCGADPTPDVTLPGPPVTLSSPVTTSPVTTSPVTTSPVGEPEELFPDVLAAELEPADDGTWRVSATLSSPYDTPERYADAWRVLAPDGTVLGVRELAHDHAAEQPFTRSLDGVEIPAGVERVVIEGRDQLSGWGGATVEVAVPDGRGG